MLSLEEFRASKRWSMNLEEDGGVDDVKNPGWLYAEDTCYIEWVEADSKYLLTIENQQWFEPCLPRLEKLLYENWYVTEVASL